MVWNDETIQNLRELWEQGHSTAEIGRRLGVSKNAIVGKAHRLDLTARPSPIRRDADRPIDRILAPLRMDGPTLPPLASVAVQALPPPAKLQMLPPLPTPQVASVADTASLSATQHERVKPSGRATPNQNAAPAVRTAPPVPVVQQRRSTPSCCWPIGEPGKKDFRFCDGASMPSKPYCTDHARLAYVKIRDRKDDAA